MADEGTHAGTALSFSAGYRGAILLTVAVFVSQGIVQGFWKVVLIAVILFATNSVVTHATARAFRSRELGHWEPLDGDPMEMVHEEKKP